MRTLMHFRDFVNEINSSNSRKFKQSVLEKYKDDIIIEKYLKIAFDPYAVYGLNAKKLAKEVTEKPKYLFSDVFDLFDYLKKNNTGRDRDIAVCYHVLDEIFSYDTEAAELLRKLICKDIVIGCDAKTINSVIPSCIPTFSVQLANRYFDAPERLEGKEFAITAKLDGFRLVAIKDVNGEIKFYSRVGQPVEGLVEIEAELKKYFPTDFMLDGELTISNYFEMESKEAYKAASKIIRLKGNTPKTGLTFRVFDCMTAKEFKYQSCVKPYTQRRDILDTYANRVDLKHIEVLPILYSGKDTSKITEWLDKITSSGGEGCMINLLWGPYVWGRTWNLQKVKKFNSLDLEVVGFEEGSGRLAGTLGALHVRYKDGNVVKVGSGFSDELRTLIWLEPEDFVGKIAEIQYFEETTNADGGISLRFPVFKEFRTDKLEPDF